LNSVPQLVETIDASPLTRALSRLRAAARRRLIFQSVGAITAAVLIYILFAAAIDYFLRMPTSVRIVLWALAVGAFAVLLRRIVPPTWTFKPSLTEMALRLERTEDGKQAGLRGLLASGLELASAHAQTPIEEDLRRRTTQDAVMRLASVRPGAILLQPKRTAKVAFFLALAALSTFAISSWRPDLAQIGVARVLTPWTDSSWPKRTEVADENPLAAHPNGSALPLRALVTKTNHEQGKTDVILRYRAIIDGKPRPEQRALLTSQGRRSAEDTTTGKPGELFERLLEPTSLAALATDTSNDKSGHSPSVILEYSFATDDDETAPHRILLVDQPTVRAARVVVTPPEYATSLLGADSPFVHEPRDLGNGTDGRGVVGPILAGSHITLSLELNKPLAPVNGADNSTKSISPSLPTFTAEDGALMRFDGAHWTIDWMLAKSRRVPIVLIDEHGIRAAEEPIFRFDAAEDRPPTSVVVDPPHDESVLPTAVVNAAVEGRDDVAIASLTLETQLAHKPSDSPGAVATAEGDPAVVATKKEWTPADDRLKVRAESTLDLATLAVKPGDEVWITAVAADVFALNGATHDPVRSAPRKLKVITPAELVEQVRAELSGVREAAMRMEREQSNIASQRSRAVESNDAASEQRQRQTALTDRLGPLDDVVKRIGKRLERNNLDDKQLQGMIEDAGALLEQAAESSKKASDSLDKVAKSSPSDSQRKQTADEAGKSQDDVDQSLTQLANMLDQGTDTYAVRREIEKLLTEQKQVQAQTSSAGQNSRGQNIESMTPGQKAELERIARRQQEIAQRSSAVLDALDKRAEQMKTADQGQSQAMQQAAKQARQNQLETNQREAAEQIKKNQTSQAEQMQAQAASALQQMLDELDQVQKQRDNTLRRQLAEIVELLRGLVTQQDTQIAALAKGITENATRGLDGPMVKLNQDTEAVNDRVRAQMKQGKRIVEFLGSASEAQSGAITALRLPNPDAPEADEKERISLSRLNDALKEAERQQQNAENQDTARKRAELLKAYRDALEAQAAIKGETDPLIGHELSRRDRVTARTLGTRQDGIRETLADLKSKTKELADATLFDYAHKRLETTMSAASKALLEGSPSATVTRDQATALAVLKSLVEALKDEDKKNDFRDQNEGGGEGGGGGGGGQPEPLVPPIAQLRLLRGMQAEAAERTRTADDSRDATEVDALSTLQRELADMGKALVEKMNEAPGGPKPDLKPDEKDDQKDDQKDEKNPEQPTPKPEEPKPEEPKKDDGGGG
jgi:hypothetical protein